MSQLDDASIRVATLLLTSALLMVGCSNSSDSKALSEDDSVGSNINSNATTSQTDANDGFGEDAIGNADQSDDSVGSANEAETNNVSVQINANTADDETVVSTPDPLIQNVTRVDFEITVPVYQSNALQVRLTWGDTQANAAWVGDELWATSLELPTNTEQMLTVTFFDDNGEIELASFDQSYRTDSNAAGMVIITADQFNSEQWDSDNDGTSNLEELTAGSNPLINEDSLLEVRESMALNELSNVTVSGAYEERIPDERPYNFTAEPPHPDFQGSRSTSISIDEDGNGSIFYSYQLFAEQSRRSATRSSAGNSISWDVSTYSTDGDVSNNLSVTNTVTVIDENKRTFIENVVRSKSGTTSQSWETNSNLTGEIIEGTSYCQPISGIITHTYSSYFGFEPNETTIEVNKESNQSNWRVTISSNELAEDEYFVRDLTISSVDTSNSDVSQEQAYFKCDFVDF